MQKKILIWDVGGVIVDWNPLQFAESYADGKYKNQLTAIFQHENWCKFDRGDLSYEEMIAIYSEQFNLPKEIMRNILQSVFHSLKPKWNTINLILKCKKAGYEQYCLTNGSKEYLHYVTGQSYKDAYHFSLYDLFSDDHIILSARINLMKPEPEIYRYVTDVFNLHDKKIIFIDDNEFNIKTAHQLGWNTIHFIDSEDCANQLKNYLNNT